MWVTMKRQVIGSFYQDSGRAWRWRAKRMDSMLRLTKLPPNARIIDLGGTTEIWRLFDHDYRITLVNCRPQFNLVEGQITGVVADACDLREVFADSAFDLVFSNSTIEHVGGADRRDLFASEVWRLAPAYWIQTPSPRFPVECHTGIPFYWQLPCWAREQMSRSRRRAMPEWDEEIRGTTVIHESEMRRLFPDASYFREYLFGFEKSYTAYRPYPE
jgi:hypothetical protein